MNPSFTHSKKAEIRMMLRFVKMFFWCYENWEYTGNQYGHLARFVSELETAGDGGNRKWRAFYKQWFKKVDLLMPEVKEISLHFIHSPSERYKSSSSNEIHEFLVTVDRNLEDLLGSKAQMFVPVKEQVELFQQKLKVTRDLVKFTAERCSSHEEELKDFKVQAQAWANRVACLLFLYWVHRNEEEAVHNLKSLLLHVLEIKPFTPAVKRVLLGALKASKSSISESFFTGNVVANSVDLILEDLMASIEDSIKTSLRDGLIILTTFLMDPPMNCGEEGNETLVKAETVVDEATSLISFLCAHEKKERIPDGRYRLLIDDSLEKIHIVRKEIKEHYVQIQDLSLMDVPRTNVLGFIDFLLENLKEKASSISFAKLLILAIEEKLRLIRAYLKDLAEQQNEIQKLKNLWIRITNAAYAVEHVIDSCFFEDDAIWHKMISLSIFKDEIELIMTEVKKIRGEFVNNVRCQGVETDSSCTISKHVESSRFDESIVGFKEVATEIIDRLTRGSRELNVVSIVGMPGQGKTTLANKIYNDPSVKYHFHRRAWCFVSQAHKRKELLLNILSCVAKEDIHSMSEDVLAEMVYKSLKGQTYLVVMDDIWDIEAWDELKESFPNDSNGSRIIFTSRIHRMASQSKLGSSTHSLCRLSIEESWELLQRKLFNKDCCPPYLLEIGMRIAEICEGLPLSLVVTAGVLARRITDFDWWKEIEGDLSSKILGERCMNILELSYRHLPNTLKSCFLYFGAFQQGKPVNARRLIRLWVAEGFIPKATVKGPENVAQDFLMDLVDRSLVIVAKRSYSMRIKECRVHDLLFDLCLTKIEQDDFLRLLKNSQCPPNVEYQEYRLSIQNAWSPFIESNPTILHARTLLLDGDKGTVAVDPSFYMKFKFLRVLDFNRTSHGVGFSEGLTSLVHLRHLLLDEVDCPYKNLTLPPSIENLKNLEVLHVRLHLEGDIFVPDTIWKMKRLKHVHLHHKAEFSLGDHLLECAKLDNVNTLSSPVLRGSEYGEELLRRFPNVKKLRIRLGKTSTGSTQFPVLSFLRNLQSLDMGTTFFPICHCRDPKFPSTLKKLRLTGINLSRTGISVIGKLPYLEVLKLDWLCFEGGRWDMEDEEFFSLKVLSLMSLNIREWNACADPFPRLQQLVLISCSKLQGIPSSFGEISSLNEIELRDCSEEAVSSARKILEEAQDMGNDGLRVYLSDTVTDCPIL